MSPAYQTIQPWSHRRHERYYAFMEKPEMPWESPFGVEVAPPYEHDAKECPACGSQGWVAGGMNVYVHGSAGPTGSISSPYGFHCTACDLEVGSKLLAHFGFLRR